MMRVAYVLCTTKALTGSHIAFKNMLKGLTQRGVDPIVVIPRYKGTQELLDDLQPLHLETFVVPFRFNIYPYLHTKKDYLLFIPKLVARYLVNKWGTMRLASFLKKKKVDLVHTNVSVVNIGYSAAQKLGIPHIYHIREYGDRIGMHYFPSKQSFVNGLHAPLSHSICITKDIQNYFLGSDISSSRVIYDGVYPQQSCIPSGEREPFILFVGRVEATKGVDQLLEAYADYVRQEPSPLPLHIVGDAPKPAFREKMETFVADNNLSALVHFEGQSDEVTRWMRKAKVIVIPSPAEGFGFCMPEAMFNGCLVIARNTGGTKEQLDNGLHMTGQDIALRYKTTKELTALLQDVHRHPIDYYKAYTDRAFNTVNSLYTQERCAEEVFKLYQQIINDRTNA